MKNSESTWSRAARCGATALVIVWATGLVVRLSIQDRFDGASLLFYAMPWPVLAVLPAGPGLWWFHRRQRVRAGAAMIAVLICAAAWWQQDWFASSQAIAETPTLRVLFRNLGHPHDDAWTNDLAATAREEADLIGLVEAESDSPERQRQLREAFSNHVVAGLPHGLVLVVRGELLDRTLIEFDAHSRCLVARVRIMDQSLTVMLVDLESTPWRSRRRSFGQLAALLDKHVGESLIVMGDFNTPRDSVYFRPWRDTLQHAFESAGSGFAETWPWPLPVLCLDHVWSTPDRRAIWCVRRWYPGHDHGGVLVTFP